MSRILLADDSPQAQRIGERILREEGFEVVSLTDGNAAVSRMADVDPDVILADVFLPNKSGLDICRFVKNDPRFQHVRVVLTAGLLEPFNEDQANAAGCDGILKKPFDASRVLSVVNALVKDAQAARTAPEKTAAEPVAAAAAAPATAAPTPAAQPAPETPQPAVLEVTHPVEPAPSAPKPTEAAAPQPTSQPPQPAASLAAATTAAPDIDVERVRAAVTVALDAAMPAMIEEITERVLIALGH